MAPNPMNLQGLVKTPPCRCPHPRRPSLQLGAYLPRPLHPRPLVGRRGRDVPSCNKWLSNTIYSMLLIGLIGSKRTPTNQTQPSNINKHSSQTPPHNPPKDTLCYAIVLPGRKSAFQAGFWPDCYRESTEIGSPAGLRRDCIKTALH